MFLYGACRQVVKTSDCDSDIRGFESHHAPHGFKSQTQISNFIMYNTIHKVKTEISGKILEQPSLAIIIDPWSPEDCKSTIDQLYKRIISFLDNNQNIKTVVLAAYDCNSEKISASNIWYKNYNDFIKNNSTRIIRDLVQVHRLFLQVKQSEPLGFIINGSVIFVHRTIDPLILNYSNHDKFQIAIEWGWELTYYLSQNTHIKNVYVLGSAWSVCVKERPLGYEALGEFKNINVLTNTDCVDDRQIDHRHNPVNLDNDSQWQKVKNKIYKNKIYLLKNSTITQ